MSLKPIMGVYLATAWIKVLVNENFPFSIKVISMGSGLKAPYYLYSSHTQKKNTVQTVPVSQKTFEQGSTDLHRATPTATNNHVFDGFILNNRHICSYVYPLQQLMVYILMTDGSVNEIFSISTLNNIQSINIKQFIQQDYLVQH